MNIQLEIIQELKTKQKEYPNAWIGYNANTSIYHVYIIPYEWCNSLLITKIN